MKKAAMAEPSPSLTTKEAPVCTEPTMLESDNGSSDYYIDHVKERRMMRKFDVSPDVANSSL